MILSEKEDVTRRARSLLREADVGHKLPTPVDDIVARAGLVVSSDATLNEDHADFFAASQEYANALSGSSYGTLKSALRKTWGLIDLRDSTIYIDQAVSAQKQAFLKLHEVGHKVLPWQRDTYLFLDDEKTLHPEVNRLYERQANLFAAEMLFQADRFALHSHDLPLELVTPLDLSRKYGASAHATIRRYVEVSQRCCSAVVLKRTENLTNGDPMLHVVYDVRSARFARQFEGLRWPTYLSLDSSLAEALLMGHRYLKGGSLVLADCDGRAKECGFQVYQNRYEAFAFVFPLSEALRGSKKKLKRVRKL